jgi:hypothetical protein
MINQLLNVVIGVFLVLHYETAFALPITLQYPNKRAIFQEVRFFYVIFITKHLQVRFLCYSKAPKMVIASNGQQEKRTSLELQFVQWALNISNVFYAHVGIDQGGFQALMPNNSFILRISVPPSNKWVA